MKIKLLSAILTITIIALLIISGPASAVTVNLKETSEDSGTYSYKATVDINTDEYIPLNMVAVRIYDEDAQKTYKCYYDIDNEDLDEDLSDSTKICNAVTIKSVDDNVDYTKSSYSYGYGYTANKTEGDMTIRFEIDSTEVPKDRTYTVRAGVASLQSNEIKYSYYSKETLDFTTGTKTSGTTTQTAQEHITTFQNSGLTVVYGLGEVPGTTYSKVMSLGDKVYFINGDELHTITLTGVKGQLAEITVASTPQTAVVPIGGAAMFDVNNDGTKDLMLQLKYAANNKALVSITEIPEEAKEPLKDKTNWLAYAVAALSLLLLFMLKRAFFPKRK